MTRDSQDPAKPKPHEAKTGENSNLKPGSPPRPATEPAGSAGSTRNPHTATDPGTGAPSGESK